jgi:hypothetical protein
MADDEKVHHNSSPTAGGNDDEASPTTTTTQAPSDSASASASALEDNITTKGKNSYYYAHGHKATGPKWDGKAEPKALSREDLMALSLDPTNNNTSSGKVPSFMYHKSNIKKYAFLDEEKVVKLYITLDGVGEQCTDSDIQLDWDESSLSLVIKNYKNTDEAATATTTTTTTGKDRSLCFGKLTGNITHAKYKLKTDKVVLTLKKEKLGIEWHTINDKGMTDQDFV